MAWAAVPSVRAAAVVALCVMMAAAQQPEIVVKEGNIVLQAGDLRGVDILVDSPRFARINGRTIATESDLDELAIFKAGMAGATLGPDVELSISFESPAGTPVIAATNIGVKGAWDGLLVDRTPYTALPRFIADVLVNQELCGSGDAGLLIVRYEHPVTLRPMSDTTSIPTTDRQDSCLDAKTAIEMITSKVRLSLKGDLLSSRSGGKTGQRVDLVEEKLAEVESIANAALQAAKSNEMNFAEQLSETITDLTSNLGDIQDCHAKGQLYDKDTDACVAINSGKTCSAVPPGAPIFRGEVVDGADGDCSAASRVFGGPPCEFVCQDGFEQVGTSSFECLNTGLWENQESDDFRCIATDCGDPHDASPFNALKDSTLHDCLEKGTKIIDSRCSISCKPGYTNKAGVTTASLKCGNDGVWKTVQGTSLTECTRVKCPRTVPDGAGSALSPARPPCDANEFGDSCKVRCETGFVGPASFQCAANGEWRQVNGGKQCTPNSLHGSFLVHDSVAGCPDADRDINNMITKEVEFSRPMVVWVTGKMISLVAGRSDLQLVVDGKLQDVATTHRKTEAWKTMDVMWVGALAEGKHTFAIQGFEANQGTYGCGAMWGDLQAFWMNQVHATAIAVPQTANACPSTRNGVLISKTIDVETPIMVVASAQIVHKGVSRADLWLTVDDVVVERGLVFTVEDAWESGKLHWVGKLSKGLHKFQIISDNPGWGCHLGEDRHHGDLNLMVVDQPDIFSVESLSDPSQLPCKTPTGDSEVLTHSITLDNENSVVMIVGHILRFGIGRNDLTLRIDGKDVDSVIAHSDGPVKRFADAHVNYIQTLGKGKHTIALYADGTNGAAWGCGEEWGNIDVVIVGE